MKDTLAEQLLGIALDWDTPIAKEEIGTLRYLAAVKYDNYLNFRAGKRFLESLAMWLRQFKTLEERRTAYNFVRNRMIYVSETQVDHLVDLLYPNRVVPTLFEQAIQNVQFSRYQTKKIRLSDFFRALRRKSLFLGLSDGARMDAFRRRHALSNEQVSVSYELSSEKWERMSESLIGWIEEKGINSSPVFENVFLIDDFSGSGKTICRFEGGQFKGKLWRFVAEALGTTSAPGILGGICAGGGPRVYVVTYLGTRKATNALRDLAGRLTAPGNDFNMASLTIMEPLQVFEDSIVIPQPGNTDDSAFDLLLNGYYDCSLEDEHTETGGMDMKHGYAGCGLPLVLFHNTPNNSVFLLWADSQTEINPSGSRALFPRISRHSGER